MTFYLSFKHELGRTCHIHMVVGLVPFYLQGAAVHDDTALASCPSCLAGGYCRGAGACSAGLGDTTAAFPDAHPNAFRTQIGKFDVGALGKRGVVF